MTTANTVYVNGNILTVDKLNSRAQAVATGGGVILAVGTKEEVLAAAEKDAVIIDLAGKTMLPGFIDAHSHFYQTGLRTVTEANLNSPPIGAVTCVDDIIALLREWAQAAPPGRLVKGFGYDDTSLREKRRLNRDDLDKVSTEHPVIVRHISGHLHAFNSQALVLAGITKETPDPSDGIFCRDAVTGEPTGVIEEALDMVNKMLSNISAAQEQQAVVAANAIYSQAGVTLASTGATRSLREVNLIRQGQHDGTVKVRVILNRAAVAVDALAGYEYDDMLLKGSGKTFQDGSIQGYTGYLSQPYHVPFQGDTSYCGYPIMAREDLVKVVKKFHDKGDQVFIHGNGDQAIADILHAFAVAQRDNPRPDPRHVVIHSQMAREDQLDTMQELGVLPSFFVLHTYYWGDRHRDIFMGPERAMRMSPAKSALDRGMIFTIHCDTPVVPQEPLRAVWSAVNRLSVSGKVIGADQRIPVEEALRAYTVNAAYQYRLENVTGSIEQGKWADFVILAEDPTQCDPARIKDIAVLETIVAGKSIFAAEA